MGVYGGDGELVKDVRDGLGDDVTATGRAKGRHRDYEAWHRWRIEKDCSVSKDAVGI